MYFYCILHDQINELAYKTSFKITFTKHTYKNIIFKNALTLQHDLMSMGFRA